MPLPVGTSIPASMDRPITDGTRDTRGSDRFSVPRTSKFTEFLFPSRAVLGLSTIPGTFRSIPHFAGRKGMMRSKVTTGRLSTFALAVVATTALGAIATACGTSGPSTASDQPTTTSTAPTTTTIAIPAALQPNAPNAAAALVADWASGNRAKALSVATSPAVTSLFDVPYPSGLAIDRGCSTAFPPLVCTYGPPGGASPTDAIFEIYVSQKGTGWYVSSVQIDN